MKGEATIVSTINAKGGVGKTTTTMLLATVFAQRGMSLRVLDGVVVSGGDHVPTVRHAGVFGIEARLVHVVHLDLIAFEVVRLRADLMLDALVLRLVGDAKHWRECTCLPVSSLTSPRRA